MFHGSYRPDDVVFLLKPIQMVFTDDLEEKESLIQSGKRHYSEMLSSEIPPSARYLNIFKSAHGDNLQRLASNCLLLASMLLDQYGSTVGIVSLARAGTPIGAIVHRLINDVLGGQSSHYSVSIIRDRGIDAVALKKVLELGYRPEQIAFVDGWTGKGVISRELHTSITKFNLEQGISIDSTLNVLTDLAGTARAACTEDYLISSSILNSTVSGLISRSVLNDAIGEGDFHGCVYFESLAEHDLSRWFLDDVVNAAKQIHSEGNFYPLVYEDQVEMKSRSRSFMDWVSCRFGIEDVNLVKPGLGEATRVLLRRYPECVLVRNYKDTDVAHLLKLAEEKHVPVYEVLTLPYCAASIIRSAAND
jgi:hypothetical protein